MSKFSGYTQTPTTRVALALLVIAILSGVGVAVPALETLSTLLLIATLLATVIDGLLLFNGRPQLKIANTELALRLNRLRTASVTIKYGFEESKFRKATTLSVVLPESFVERTVEIDLPQMSPVAESEQRATFAITPLERGDFIMEEIFEAGHSRLGFWNYRSNARVSWKFKVYPNLSKEEPSTSAFLIRRDMSGLTTRRIMGIGREFDRLREYQNGDPYSDISWKASARRMSPITIVKQIERTQQVYALLDASRLSRRIVDHTTDESSGVAAPLAALDRFINGTLSLAIAANSQGDSFGAIAFSRYPSLFLKARPGQNHFVSLQNALSELKADSHHPNYEELFSQVRTKIRNRALLVVFTHLDEASLVSEFIAAARIVSRQHLVLAVSIMPDFARPLFSEPDVQESSDIYGRLAGHLSWKRLAEAETKTSAQGIRLALARQDNLCAQAVSRYLQIKERQLV